MHGGSQLEGAKPIFRSLGDLALTAMVSCEKHGVSSVRLTRVHLGVWAWQEEGRMWIKGQPESRKDPT
jgi:hypothetical protein